MSWNQVVYVRFVMLIFTVFVWIWQILDMFKPVALQCSVLALGGPGELPLQWRPKHWAQSVLGRRGGKTSSWQRVWGSDISDSMQTKRRTLSFKHSLEATHMGFLCVPIYCILEGTARYAAFTSSSCGGLLPLAETRQKRAFLAVLAYFRPLLVFCSKLSNFY